MAFSMWDALNLAMNAHQGQVDKIGKPYIGHVVAVAQGVASFGDQAIIVGLLHDVVEDTDLTFADLYKAGVSAEALQAIRLLTKRKGQPNDEYLAAIAMNSLATWVKISDNAHNSLPERAAEIQDEQTRERLARKYARAREILWKAVPRNDIRQILRVVNPTLGDLLEET